MNKKINLFINLNEFYYRLIYICLTIFSSFFISFFYKIEIFYIISKFFILYEKKGFIYINLLDPIIIYIKISILIALIFSLPICIYIYIFFFFKSIQIFLIKYIFLYFLSFYLISFNIFIFCYFKLFPLIINFLLRFQLIDIFMPLKLTLQATMDKYFFFFFNFILILFIILISINLMFFLAYVNFFSKKFIIKFTYKKFLY